MFFVTSLTNQLALTYKNMYNIGKLFQMYLLHKLINWEGGLFLKSNMLTSKCKRNIMTRKMDGC